MKRTIFLTASLLALIGVLCLSSSLFAAEVAQGKCVKLDAQAKTLTLELYDTVFDKANPYGNPTGEEIEINYANSLIGVEPQEGDVLRIAYTKKDSVNAAIRLMNVTKQGLMNK